MELYATDLHFLGDTPKDRVHDYCVHGKVVFKIDACNLSNEDSDWCVSASAYRFLRSIFDNHFTGADEQMIPCCGHFLIPSQNKTCVTIIGCPNGIDFDIIHEDNNIIIRTQDGTTYTVTFNDYKAAVLSYANQIQDFIIKIRQDKLKTVLIKMVFLPFVTNGIVSRTKQPIQGIAFPKYQQLCLTITIHIPKMRLQASLQTAYH